MKGHVSSLKDFKFYPKKNGKQLKSVRLRSSMITLEFCFCFFFSLVAFLFIIYLFIYLFYYLFLVASCLSCSTCDLHCVQDLSLPHVGFSLVVVCGFFLL